MDNNRVSLDLMEFVECNILPRYTVFDKAHNLSHVNRVIKNALQLARITGADINMVYVAAAYHDLGLEGPRAVHHLTGGKILYADKRLAKWFSPYQIKIMREAVEDHRASASHVPRSIYGKIVAEADRDISHDSVFRRAVIFGLDNYPEKTKEEQWQRFAEHMDHKYSSNGYIRLWIQHSQNERNLLDIRNIIADRQHLYRVFEQMYGEETEKRMK